MTWRDLSRQEAGSFQADDLKICDLCGALNLASNGACFVCGWRGRFERRPEVVKIAMELMERQNGRLQLQLLTSPLVYQQSARRTLMIRLSRILSWVRHWLFE